MRDTKCIIAEGAYLPDKIDREGIDAMKLRLARMAKEKFCQTPLENLIDKGVIFFRKVDTGEGFTRIKAEIKFVCSENDEI